MHQIVMEEERCDEGKHNLSDRRYTIHVCILSYLEQFVSNTAQIFATHFTKHVEPRTIFSAISPDRLPAHLAIRPPKYQLLAVLFLRTWILTIVCVPVQLSKSLQIATIELGQLLYEGQ